MESINDYLESVFKRFKEYIEKHPKLCELKTVNYDRDAFPNYNHIHVQEDYLLRYAFAYAFEYKKMYDKIFGEALSVLPETIRILSIGCGNGIDYWAAAQVIDKIKPNIKIEYVGVDKCKWKYIPSSRKGDSFKIIHQDIIDYLNANNRLNFNVIIFPKSISEFNNQKMIDLCREFEKARLNLPYFRMLFSLRENNDNLDADLDKVDLIVEAFKNNSTRNLSPHKYKKYDWHLIGENGIKSYDRSFTYPENILSYLGNLHTNCQHYQNHGEPCVNCESNRLNRFPILNVRHIRIKYVYMKEEK